MSVVQIRYGENFVVDSKYSSMVLKNLFYNPIFFPGLTYTNKYLENEAGQIFINRILPGQEVKVGKPAQDFVEEKLTDELIPIRLNNSFAVDKKVYEIQSSSVAVALLAEGLEIATKQVQESWNKSALCCLEADGNGTSIQGLPLSEDPNIDPKKGVYIKKAILGCKTQLFKDKTQASVVLCSPETYETILMAAGKEFTPSLNDQMVKSAEIIQWLGLKFINCNLIGSIALEYYNNGATDEATEKKIEITAENAAKVDFIMYDPMAFSILTNLNAVRFMKDVKFIGTHIQIMVNSGYCVTQPKSVIVRKHTV